MGLNVLRGAWNLMGCLLNVDIHKLRLHGFLVSLLSFLVLSMSAKSWAAKPSVDTYVIDPVHTFVMFKVNHLGFSHSYGRFTDVKGTLKIDEKNPANTKIDIEIAAASIDTQDKKRDKHLRGPDFFNVVQFPKITFKSTKVEKKSGKNYRVTGDLSLHGEAKSVSFDFDRLRTGKDPWDKVRTGGDFNLTIKRSDYNMKYMLGENKISDEVELIVSVEAIKKK
jgi:polyisoprenoid-binding protein YceI